MKVAPAPWSLTGDGFIWLFKFPRDFIKRNGFMAGWRGCFRNVQPIAATT